MNTVKGMNRLSKKQKICSKIFRDISKIYIDNVYACVCVCVRVCIYL